MQLKAIRILLPCHSLEDFPTHHDAMDARVLLAAWTAPWHPALIAAAGSLPQWSRIDDATVDVQQTLVIVPSVARSQIPGDLRERTAQGGGELVVAEQGRPDLVNRLLGLLDQNAMGVAVADELVQDFFALSYTYLQVQLLTRQMRYSSNLDEERFAAEVVAAGRHATAGEPSECRARLQAAFDLLAQERDLYYSVDAYIVDVTVVSPAHVSEALLDQLQWRPPTSLLLMPESCERFDASGAESFREAVIAAVAAGRATLLRGGIPEGPAMLAPAECLLRWARRCEAWQQARFGAAGQVFAQRRFALAPQWPQVLERLQFRGALHFALDDGRFPAGSQAKVRWDSPDGSGVEAVARTPMSGDDDGAFLRWFQKLGESMDMDHVAVLSIAHWPDSGCPSYRDLTRAASYGAALGRFVTAAEFFDQTDRAPHSDRHSADKYGAPYLAQDVARGQADPISRYVRLWKGELAWRTLDALAVLQHCAGGRGAATPGDDSPEATQADAPRKDDPWFDDRELDALRQAADSRGRQLSRTLCGAGEADGRLLINTHNAPCRVLGRSAEQGRAWVGDVPGAGFVWAADATAGAQGKPAIQPLPPGPKLVDGLTLRNEFLQAEIHAASGGLKSLHDYQHRGNRFSQRLGVRQPTPPRQEAVYSDMQASSVRVTQNSELQAEIEAIGSLSFRGRKEAEFVQRWRLCRTRRYVELEIEVDLDADVLTADPWNHYLGARFAWPDPGATLHRSIGGNRCAAESKRLESPLYLEIDNGSQRTVVLTGGLPYHRRVSLSSLDTLLSVRGERCRVFRMAIGLDLPRVAQAAEQFIEPPLSVPAPRPASETGWLLHCDARNATVTHWETARDSEDRPGVQLRVQETSGRPARIRLQGPREIQSATLTDFLGNAWGKCRLEDGAACWELAAHEWTQVRAFWSEK